MPVQSRGFPVQPAVATEGSATELLYAVPLVQSRESSKLFQFLVLLCVKNSDFGIRKAWIQCLPLPPTAFVWLTAVNLCFLSHKMGS